MRSEDLTGYRVCGACSGGGVRAGFKGEGFGVWTGVDYVVLDTHVG